jgi:hypothetical protein
MELSSNILIIGGCWDWDVPFSSGGRSSLPSQIWLGFSPFVLRSPEINACLLELMMYVS